MTAPTTAELAPTAATRSPAPTWSSCGSTRSATRTWPARWRAGGGRSIVTCRPAWEGGQFDGSEEERRAILREALALGAEYVDVEWRARLRRPDRADGGRRIVLSTHDFDGVPADLAERARAMRATGAEVVKIAGDDDAPERLPAAARPGRADAAAERPGADRHGRVRPGDARAAGAVRLALDLRRRADARSGSSARRRCSSEYRFRSITTATDVYGLVGSPVAHSVSPAMHNAAFRAAGIDAVYLPLPAADADDFVTFARAHRRAAARA